MKIRLYVSNDLDDILELFYKTIHTVNKDDYTQEQLDAWAPKNADRARWESCLSKNHTLVVEDDGKIVGFADMGDTGYLDRLYVDSDYVRQGVASLLVQQLEKYARVKKVRFMNTASSITARPFFEANGYTVIREQVVERRGERLLQYLMEKKL